MPSIPRLVELASRSPDSPSKPHTFSLASFSLNASGFAGFFGGKNAVTAVATVQLYSARRWGGWYNTPGAYEIAQKYGQLSNSHFWNRLFPGPKREPAELFGLDGGTGPSYFALHSGTKLPSTNHPAYLLANKAAELGSKRKVKSSRDTTTSQIVTVVDLRKCTPSTIREVRRLEGQHALLPALPIAASLAACALCGFFGDWWCFASIVQGILTSGLTCAVVGLAKLTFKHPSPANGSPKGDGILLDRQKNRVVVLRGDEGAVNILTRGQFSLKYISESRWHFWIGLCSVLLILQFLAQLVLIPQGSLVGQALFVASLAVSWIYNTLVTSQDQEELQTRILLRNILKLKDKQIRRFELDTWTTGVVLTCLALEPKGVSDVNIRNIVDAMIPNDTEVWRRWKQHVVQKLHNGETICCPAELLDQLKQGLDEEDARLLKDLMGDAVDACEGWNPSSPDSPSPLRPASQPRLTWWRKIISFSPFSSSPGPSSEQHHSMASLSSTGRDTPVKGDEVMDEVEGVPQ